MERKQQVRNLMKRRTIDAEQVTAGVRLHPRCIKHTDVRDVEFSCEFPGHTVWKFSQGPRTVPTVLQ